jgi:hypothetical protein
MSRRWASQSDAFHFWPKRVSLSISVNPLTCGFGLSRHPHEGGDGAERGAKLGATARKPWVEGSSGVLGRSKVQLDPMEVSCALMGGGSWLVPR